MSKEIKYIKYFFVLLLIALTLFIGTSLVWNIYKEYQAADDFARVEAHASYNKDLLYRRWASMHGGVYVPITDKTLSNPYLAFIPERDITTPSGKKLTLMNPAYMTRQVLAIGDEQYGVKGHLTSLKPIRPENKADEWETSALKRFEKGEKEYSSLEQINGNMYLRYMGSMIVEKGCLKCHEKQGYKLGEVRGGISVSVPMKKYYEIIHSKIIGLSISHSVIYLSVLILCFLGYNRLLNEMLKRNKMQQIVIESEASLMKQNKEYATLNEEYKSQNEALHVAKEKAEESDSLKTAFLQNMSHEIRTPMNAIVGFGGLLDNADLSPEKQKWYLSIILNSTNQLLTVVNDILTISSIETNQEGISIKPICINTLIANLFTTFQKQAESKQITLHTKTQLTDLQSEIESDQNKLERILTNLLTNALKFTHAGSIEFGYSITNQNHNESEIEFFVKDSGIGISADSLDKIFEHFRQADMTISRRYGGTGLGLSISKGFVELLGGKIWVKSAPEKGSTFYFSIPYNPIHKVKVEDDKSKPYKATPTVLIAEDEDYNYLYIKELLSNMNLNVLRAFNGKEAVDICRSNPDIGLILMDIKMPIMDGHTAAMQIKVFRPNLPIWAQTAYALQHEHDRYIKTFDDYIIKPINQNELNQKLLKYIENH